jgi:hypothetical protein
MFPFALFALAMSLGGPLPSAAQSSCWATDYASDSLTLRAEPSAKAASVLALSKSKAHSLVRLDGFNDKSRDWLKVQANGTEGWLPVRYVVCRLSPEDAEKAVKAEATEIVQALKKTDMQSVAAYVHPAKGLRFSPYANVDRKVNVHSSASDLKSIADGPAKRTWGIDDGSGEPIRLTFSRYYSKFIYDRDFVAAPKVTYNDPTEGAKKAWEEFPSAVIVNYGFGESGKNHEDHLLLTFEQQHGKWYLTGIIHDGWTI